MNEDVLQPLSVPSSARSSSLGMFFRRSSSGWENHKKQNSHRTARVAPFLKRATSFDFNASSPHNIPAIKTEEVVFPGSALQQQMASKMCETLEEQGEECVICMDGFSPDNPRMPTICACGENKTYFHLPCLYQWMDQHEECPSCRGALTWEEF